MKEQEKLSSLNSFVYRMKKGHQRSKLIKNNQFMTILNGTNNLRSSSKGLYSPIKQLKQQNCHKKMIEPNLNYHTLNLKNKTKKQLPLFAKLFTQVDNIQEKQYNKIHNEINIQKISQKNNRNKFRPTLMHKKVCINSSIPIRMIGKQEKQKNNLSLLLCTSYKQSRWHSLEVKQNEKNICSFNQQFQMQNEQNNQDPQIQFYNTKSIFIFKKTLTQDFKTQSNTLRINTNKQSKKKIPIKYKKRILESPSKYQKNKIVQKKLSFDDTKFSPLQQQFILNKSYIPQMKRNYSQCSNQNQNQHFIKYRCKNKQLIKTEQNKFIEGKQKLQPWEIKTQQQCHQYQRLSLFAES